MRQQEKLGKGGFSSVYRPTSFKEGQKHHVIKRPNPDVSQQEKRLMLKKYKRQKKLLDYLHKKYPQTLFFNQIYNINDDQVQVSMKDLGNTDLNTIVRNQFDRLTRDVDHVIPQLINAIISLFHAHVVHKDIKLDNIMANYNQDTGHYTITLIDFADSMVKNEILEKYNKFIIAGTVKFMSPELLLRVFRTGDTKKGTWEEYIANDLWSLGIVLYFILYGEHPHSKFTKLYPSQKQRTNSPNKFYDKMKQEPELYDELFSTEILPDIKKKYVPIVKSLLSLNPTDRIDWLINYLKEQRKKRSHGSNSIQQTQYKKKARGSSNIQKPSETSGISMLLRASQQIKNKQQKKKPSETSGMSMLMKSKQQQNSK